MNWGVKRSWPQRIYVVLTLGGPATLIAVGSLMGLWYGPRYPLAVAIFGIGYVLAHFSVAIALYIQRETDRLIYGLLEVVFAVLLVLFTLFYQVPAMPASGVRQYDVNTVTYFAQVAAALYVLVRGFDNIGVGVKKYPRLERVWSWLMLKNRSNP